MYTTKCILHKCTQGIQCDAYFNVLICIHFVSYFYVRILNEEKIVMHKVMLIIYLTQLGCCIECEKHDSK